MKTPLSVEQFVSGTAGRTWLDVFMGIFLPKHGYWITGGAGRYAWSEGTVGGMKGKAHPVDAKLVDPVGSLMATSMHRNSVAYCMNQNAGAAVIMVGPGKFRMATVGLFGYGKWKTFRWKRENGKFEALPPLGEEENYAD
jgi:hypothetical protein